jgi:hypothetical protein
VSGRAETALTVLVPIPRHFRVEKGKNAATNAELARYNWPRSVSIGSQ